MNIIQLVSILFKEHLRLRLTVLKTQKEVKVIEKRFSDLIAHMGANDGAKKIKIDSLLAQQSVQLLADLDHVEHLLEILDSSPKIEQSALERLIQELQKEPPEQNPGESTDQTHPDE